MSGTQPSFLPKPRGFVTTHWTLIRACAQSDPENYLARVELCHAYWYPVYVRLRGLGHSGHDAEDLTQDFFAKILAESWFVHIDQTRGRFRSFLLSSLGNFLRDRHARRTSLKRGGGSEHLPLEFCEAEARYASHLHAGAGPEQAYELEWAASVVSAAWKRLEAEFSSTAEKKALFDAIKIYLGEKGVEVPQETIAATLGTTVEAVKVSVHRLRKRYGALLREEVTRTVAAVDDVDEEMRHLREVLATGLVSGE